ncbi:M23/M37 family peptidase [Desmospora sp. 8437]|nr:M23/M37 family peptidase [Desmospora sp. 8437]
MEGGKEGRRDRMKSRWFAGAAAFSLAFSTIPVMDAQAEGDVEKARKDLEEIRKEKKEIKGEIREARETMDQEKEKMERISEQIHQSNEEIFSVKQKVKKVQKDLDRAENRFQGRIDSIYRSGKLGYMSTLLESDSLSQFLARFETLSLLVKRDHLLMEEIAAKKKEIKRQQRELEKLNKKREQEIEEAKETYNRMQENRKKSKVALAGIEEEEHIQEKEVRRVNLLALKNGSFKYPGGALSWPGKSQRITSPYGYRVHPVTGVYKLHTGIDTAGNAGDPIYAAADGIVLESQPASGYGWIIILDHGSGLTTLYAHMYPHTVRVQKGDYVERGQRIASVGSNGYSTGPHNHFEVRKQGRLQNPLKYLK